MDVGGIYAGIYVLGFLLGYLRPGRWDKQASDVLCGCFKRGLVGWLAGVGSGCMGSGDTYSLSAYACMGTMIEFPSQF